MANVLIVDDLKDLADMVAEVLNREGHQTGVCYDGAKAIDIIVEQSGITHLVVDILMPGKDGLDVIQATRNNRPDIKIIAMSGGGVTMNKDSILSSLSSRADHVLSKPLDIEKLLECIS